MKELYSDDEVVLCVEEAPKRKIWLDVNGERYRLDSYPAEPCTFIKKEVNGQEVTLVTIHNAFCVYSAVSHFLEGKEVNTIIGKCYDLPSFCEFMVKALELGQRECDMLDVVR